MTGRGRPRRGPPAGALAAAVLLAAGGCGGAPARSGLTAAGPGTAPPEAGEPIDLELPSLDGGRFRLSDERGRVVVLHFFATFDGPSQSLALTLEQVHAAYRPRGALVVGVAMDPAVDARTRRDVVESYAALNNLSFEVVLADEALVEGRTPVGRVPEIPATIVVDPEGRPVASFTGTFTRSELEELLDRVLSGQGPSS